MRLAYEVGRYSFIHIQLPVLTHAISAGILKLEPIHAWRACSISLPGRHRFRATRSNRLHPQTDLICPALDLVGRVSHDRGWFSAPVSR
jgi:hypothetical protein